MKKMLMVISLTCLLTACGDQITESGVSDSAPEAPDARTLPPPPDAEYQNDPPDVLELADPTRAYRRCVIDGDCKEPMVCWHEECLYELPPFPDGGIWF